MTQALTIQHSPKQGLRAYLGGLHGATRTLVTKLLAKLTRGFQVLAACVSVGAVWIPPSDGCWGTSRGALVRHRQLPSKVRG